MSAKAKAQAKIRRASLKRARKDSMQKQYQAWAAAGQNQLSKRSKLAAKRKKAGAITTKRHIDRICQNHGCVRCHPQLNSSAYAAPGSCFYGSRFEHQPKPWQTAKEKLTILSQKKLQEQQQAKSNRQACDAQKQEALREAKQKLQATEALWLEWANARRQARAEAKAQEEALRAAIAPEAPLES